MTISYEEAVERGYDGPRPGRKSGYRCGGWGDYHGPCGAEDCESCHPGCNDEEEEEEEGRNDTRQ